MNEPSCFNLTYCEINVNNIVNKITNVNQPYFQAIKNRQMVSCLIRIKYFVKVTITMFNLLEVNFSIDKQIMCDIITLRNVEMKKSEVNVSQKRRVMKSSRNLLNIDLGIAHQRNPLDYDRFTR